MNSCYYLSSLPGVGKTRIAVQAMRKHLKTGTGLIIYVAPTLLLLRETRSFLTKGLSQEASSKIRSVVSTGKSSGSVAYRLNSLLLGSDFALKKEVRDLEDGSVILMTHQGFMSLPDSLPRKGEIEVIFDEARKFTAGLQPIELRSKKEAKLLALLIKNSSTPLIDSDGKNTGFLKFSLEKPPTSVLKKITQSSKSRGQFSALKSVVDRASNKQTDVYVKTVKTKSTDKTHFYEVVMPSRIFSGYKNVIVMSAFLEDTQMWHLMKGRVDLKPLWEHPDFSHVKDKVDSHTEKIMARFSRLCIAPVSIQGTVVSLSRLANSVLVPVTKAGEIQDKLESLGVESLSWLLEVSRKDSEFIPNEVDIAALTLLREYKAKREPLGWYLKQAVSFVEKLNEEHRVEGDVLAVINESHEHLLDKFPSLTKIPTVSHGLNKYLNSNVLVFMAAINPTPPLIALYRALLPGYDWKRDYLADTLAQSVTRLCIRDVDSEAVAYVIVPDSATAELLRSKLLDQPIISMRATQDCRYTALTTLNPKRKKASKLKTTKKSSSTRTKAWLDKDENKKIRSLRVQRSVYKKRAADGKRNAAERLVVIERELEKVLARRDKLKEAEHV